MPAKGSTLKTTRVKGVNKTKLKKEGFAFEPPIPEDQFGGNKQALRQFKALYQKDGKGRKDKQLKGLLKDLETGRLYLANEDKTRYVELSEEEYDNIVKEIGERVGIDGGEPRVGIPYQGRTKDQEVIEEEEEEPEPASEAVEPALVALPMRPTPEYLNKMVEALREEKDNYMIMGDDSDAEKISALPIYIFGKSLIINENLDIYDEKTQEKVGEIYDGEEGEIVLEFMEKEYIYESGDAKQTASVPKEEPESESESEEKEEIDYENPEPVDYQYSDLRRGNFIITKDSEVISPRFVPSLNRNEDSDLFPKLFTYRWRDVWWVLNQKIENGVVINPDFDDKFSFEDEETEEEEVVVGYRAMRGRRRVIIVKPPKFKLKETDEEDDTIYIYDAGKKYYDAEDDDTEIGIELEGGTINSSELTPDVGGGVFDEATIRFEYISKPFNWQGEDPDEDGNYSEDEMGFDKEPDDLELLNPPVDNEIESKDADYIVEQMAEYDVSEGLRIRGGSAGYDDEEDEVWINKFEEFTTEKKLREEIFSELVEELLSGEVDEKLKSIILEEMGVLDSKKEKMVSAPPKKKFKIRPKKTLTKAQLQALAAARAIRAAKKAEEKN